MFRKTIGSLLLALAALVPTAACARAPEARPALWKLADEDTTIYLFGTVHALPRELACNAGAVRAALDYAGPRVGEVADEEEERRPDHQCGTRLTRRRSGTQR